MNANPYLWLTLFVLAIVGFALAMRKDMKPTTPPRDMRWCRWMSVMALLAAFDAAMLINR